MTTSYNATKVFAAGIIAGAIAVEAFNFATRDARGSACIIPFLPTTAFTCTADPKVAGEKPCKCTECGMQPKESVPST